MYCFRLIAVVSLLLAPDQAARRRLKLTRNISGTIRCGV